MRRLAGFGDHSHHACRLIGLNVAVQLRRCLSIHRKRTATTLASDVVVKPPVEQFKFFRHRGMMPLGTAAIKAGAEGHTAERRIWIGPGSGQIGAFGAPTAGFRGRLRTVGIDSRRDHLIALVEILDNRSKDGTAN